VEFSNTLDFGEEYYIRAIGLDSLDNIIIGGHFFHTINDQQVAFVAKLNTDATAITWQKTIYGDSNDTFLFGLAVDFNNDIVITGSTEIPNNIDGNSDSALVMLVAKVTTAGALSWQKTIALESNTPYGVAGGVSLDSIGNIYVAGTYYVDNPTADNGMGPEKKSNAIVIFKMTTLGTMVWDRRVGPGPCSWVGISTAVGDDGDLYLYAGTYEFNPLGNVEGQGAGYYTTRLILARYNKTTGAVVWQSYFDNPLAQEAPGEAGNNGPYGAVSTDLMTVRGDKILIGGSVRFGQSDEDLNSPWSNSQYFNQGFVAQFDTDATKFSADGWELKTSRVPGKLTNTLVATTGPVTIDDGIEMSTDTPVTIVAADAAISVRRTASRVNTWTFGKDGTLTAPVDSNIKLQQTQLGFVSIYGIMNQSDDSIWYNSVCHDAEGNAYTLGSSNWSDGYALIQKFDTEGKQLWTRQLRSGSGASFDVASDGVTYTVATVSSGGDGYKVGDKIVINGGDLGGSSVANSLTLEVATIANGYDYVGAVATVDIISGVPVGSGSWSNVRDYYDDAECEPVAMAIDPLTGNIAVLITTPTYNGDTLDSEWTETVVLMIDSGSGAVVKSFTLADEGDVYGYDIAVSATGKPAVVGQKFNEYNEYGSITPLAGSSVDKLWVTKADIDTEHFPGEVGGSTSDWWITGTSITDQVQVTDVNYYSGLTGTLTARPGSGLIVDVTINLGQYSLVDASLNPGANYIAGQKFLITGDLLGGTTPANDLTFNVGVGGGGDVTAIVNISGTAGGPDQVYAEKTPTKVNGSGANFFIYFDPTTGAINSSGINTSVGIEYLVGDVITIPGTSFAGGTSPANDVTVTVTNVSGTEIANPQTFSGTHPTTHLLINTNRSVDFAAEESFAIKQNLGSEAFIWTPDFTKAIGGNNSDWFGSVVWDAAGANLYAVGSGRYDVTYDQGLVVKYSSSGTLVASKYINDSMGNNDADNGAVALMADDSIVVIHEMYNNVRDNTDEVLVTKLDSDLRMVWQQFLGYDSDDGWNSPNDQISVAVDPASDEIVIAWEANDYDAISGDDAAILVKLDTDGQVLWKRVFGIYESDTNLNSYNNGNRALSIHGDKFTFVGATDGPGDNTNNAFIATLPLDGTGTGLHDYWTYAELNDNRIRVQVVAAATSTTFTPNVHSDGITDTENVKHYFTDYPDDEFTLYPTVIRSNEGGAIEFADGSKQTFSAAIIPQVKSGENLYTLRAEDSGRHILVESENYTMYIPHWERTTLPIGYTVTIINISGSELNIENEYGNSNRGVMWWSGGDMHTPAVGIADNGSGQMVTLVKIKEGTYSDDGDQHGDIWMIAGADLSNND